MENIKLKPIEDSKCILELNPPRLLQYLMDKKSEFVPNIITVARKVEPILNRISNIFPNYTQHDINHSIRIMEDMFNLVGELHDKSELEITILIYSALLHDVGMYASEDEIALIKNDKLKSDISFDAVVKKYGDIELAIQFYIRKLHSSRSHNFIKNNLHKFLYVPSQPSVNFCEDVCLCCESHTQDINWLKQKLVVNNQKAIYYYNLQYLSILLRLGDILDIDSNRTPPFLYELLKPKGISDKEWKQHFIIYNRDKIINDHKSNQKKMILRGKCNNPEIHRKLLKYIDWINDEIKLANSLTEKMDSNYNLNLKYPVEDCIETEGYKISNLKLKVDFIAIVNILMGEKIYGSKDLGLRELIQNSIDACKVRQKIEYKEKELWELTYKPSIRIILNQNENQVIIKDNGIGMTQEIINNYFLNIGKSYYKSDDFILRDLGYEPIGNFGIGFLACFMLSEDVNVRTRYYKDIYEYEIQLSKNSEYICLDEKTNSDFHGTEIRLKYDSFMSVFNNDKNSLIDFLNEFFLTNEIEIQLIDTNNHHNSYTVRNELELKKDLEQNHHIIDISEYLEDVYGYIEIKLSREILGESIRDISRFDNIIYYDGKVLNSIDETFDLNNICENNEIKYYNIPIVPDYYVDDYERALDILGNKEEAIEKIEDNLDYVSLFVCKDINDVINKKTRDVIYDYDYIINDLKFEELQRYGQSLNCPTIRYGRNINLILDTDSNKFIRYYNSFKDNLMFFKDINRGRIFLRNIYVTNYYTTEGRLIYPLKIKNIDINICNKNILPEISRKNLQQQSKKMLDYAINKIIHLWILENIKLTHEEAKMLELFIEKFYKEDNILIKKK